MELRKPAPDPPRGRVSPAGSAPARSRGRAPDRGFVVVLITGPVRVLVPVPVLSFASVLHAGAGCTPGPRAPDGDVSLRHVTRGVHPRPAGAGGRVSGPDPGGSPDTASPLVRAAAPELPGKRPRGSRRGCHLDPRRPQGGADPVGAGRARGGRSWRGPSPGRVRAQEGCSAGSWRCSPVRTTCVPLDHGGPTVILECEVHVSASGAQRCRAPRSARSSGNPRERRVTAEIVT